MIKINYAEAVLSADEKVKQREATKQMRELLGLLSNGVKYATLTVADRAMLLKKGFAKDLVDNIVFFTERSSEDLRSKTHDQLVLGFTHAAFDPSIYACDSIVKSLVESHHGRCAYCESQIDHVSRKHVSHFRPAWGAMDGSQLDRQAYYSLAYEPNNLLYSCEVCNEVYKGSQFPVLGSRASSIELRHEQALLVNPYEDDPRSHIRFNPLTACAYAFDELSAYCQYELGIKANEIDSYLANSPQQIPFVDDAVDKESLNADYRRWVARSEQLIGPAKGRTSIAVLGLNRPELVRARLNYLRQTYGVFSTQRLGGAESDTMQKYLDSLSDGSSPNNSYCSMMIDAIAAWNSAKNNEFCWFKQYAEQLSETAVSKVPAVTPQFTSSLHYMVLETELQLEGKRRIVYLHSSDFLYGSDRKAKTVFLPIDWERDFANVIKVSSEKLLWEASFSELADTQAVALQSLFANNELWAEGNYPALA